VSQNPGLARKFPTYKSFADATITDVYSRESLDRSWHLMVRIFASCYLENTGNGKFKMKVLPNEAQLSALNDIIIEDVDGDNNPDILAAGNLFNVEVVTPRNDAGAGIILKGDGKGNFTVITPAVSGFFVPGDVKSMALVHLNNNNKIILIGNNNDRLQILQFN
jgi:hypothetical protein